MREFDYDLPRNLIAQTPLQNRADSRLLVLDRMTHAIRHSVFRDLGDFLAVGDLLVVNDTRVIPARLLGARQSGGAVELLLLREESPQIWRALIRPAKRLKSGDLIVLREVHGVSRRTAVATILEKLDKGQALIRLDPTVATNLEDFGQPPLPPYITERLSDAERYQTVFSKHPGSAAAPTAGLHFTDETVSELTIRGIEVCQITLHVGLDTFRPVTEEYAEDHEIHREWCSVSRATAARISKAKDEGHRVVAVGTTVARTLESFARSGEFRHGGCYSGMTDMFITPGHSWKLVDALITNFHLPKSTLLLMVSAFAGRKVVLDAYQQAIEHEYRFFSFGDAMLIL